MFEKQGRGGSGEKSIQIINAHETGVQSRKCVEAQHKIVNTAPTLDNSKDLPHSRCKTPSPRSRVQPRGDKVHHLLVLKISQLDENLGRRVLHVQLFKNRGPVVGNCNVSHLYDKNICKRAAVEEKWAQVGLEFASLRL